MFSIRPVPGTTSQVFVSSAEMTKIEFEAKRTQNQKNALHEKHKTLTAKIPDDLVKSAMHASYMQHCKHLLTGSAKESVNRLTRLGKGCAIENSAVQVHRENVWGVPGLSTAYQHIVIEHEQWTEIRQRQEERKEEWTAWMTKEGRIVYKSESGETTWSHPALDLQPLPPGIVAFPRIGRQTHTCKHVLL
jgi:hypothetical protein